MELWHRLRRDLARRGRPVGRDQLPFLAVSAVVVIAAAQWSEPGSGLDLVLLGLAGASLTAHAVLPRVPAELLVSAVLVPVCLAVGREGHLELALFLVVVATLFAAWHLGPTTRAVAVTVLCGAGMWLVATIRPDSYTWPPWIAAEVFTLVLGRLLFQQHTLIAELESARRALADRAVAEERRRIARELHDLAGHTLAAMLLHLTGARHVLRRDIDEAERALVDAEQIGRDSMAQIRTTVSALRTTERGTDPPVPDAGDLDELIGEYQRAGLQIDATIDSAVHRADRAVGTAVHRITREALANVARHAPANRVVITVDADTDRGTVHLVIADLGRRPSATGPDGARFGLVGMAERARALGGTLVAEPTADGWRVEATLALAGSRPEETVPS